MPIQGFGRTSQPATQYDRRDQGADMGWSAGGGGGVPSSQPMDRNWDYGPGENPRAGFSARQSPMEAGVRTGVRNMVPGASFAVDRPEAGSGMDTWWKKLAGGIPWLGAAAIQPYFAGSRAAEARGRNEYLYPEPESLFSRGMGTASAAARFVPGGQAGDIFKNVVTGVQAGRGISDFFNFSPEQAISGAAGYGLGQLGRSAFGPPGSRDGQGGMVPGGSSYRPNYQPSDAQDLWNMRGEGGGGGEGYTTQNWAAPQPFSIPSSWQSEERG